VWLARMEAHGEMNWLIIEKPQRVRLLIDAYFSKRTEAQALADAWGGQVSSVSNVQPKQKPGPPMQVSDALEIWHEAPGRRSARGNNRLYIPYGMAFGSGEHATTWMLLRALARRDDWANMTLLDLGTGSGVLALAARKLGAREIVGTDFDPDAVRTARQNEALNFTSAAVRWECADVKRLRSTKAHSLIVANLSSGILCDAASRIARALRPGGELWLSGILRTQQEDVAAAYRGAGLQLVKTTTCGKWVMQQWRHSN
jgi:ribosomal protein L11 methyltransferase